MRNPMRPPMTWAEMAMAFLITGLCTAAALALAIVWTLAGWGL